MKIIKFFILSLLTLPCFSHADIAVIVSQKASVATLSIGEVKRIYLSKLKELPNGEEVVPIDQNSESAIYAEFYENAVKKSLKQLRSYWTRMVFTGGGSPPKQSTDGSSAIIALVANNPNMIGYINMEDVDDSVKVILTVPSK